MTINDTEYHSQRIQQTDRIYSDGSLLPHRYVFILTNKCNLRCSFCFQEKNYIDGSLTTEDWIKVVEQLPDYAHVTLTGGEPFLFKGFKEVFLKVTEKHTCNIISNGLLLDEEVIDLLLSRKNFQVLSISVDNIGNTVRDVDVDKWKKAEEFFRLFTNKRNKQKSHAVLDTKTVVLDQNAKQLFEIYKYCVESLKSDTHSFMLLKGSPIQHSDQMYNFSDIFVKSNAHKYINFKDIIFQLEQVRKYNLLHGKRCFTHPKFADLNGEHSLLDFNFSFINAIQHTPANFKSCKAPWGSVHINVEGHLFPCMAVKMGNVKVDKISKIFFSKEFEKFKNTIETHGTVEGCNRCGYLLPTSGLGQEIS
jgi:MoaA/NifB/PqqE/SkfB family radical SAM enzyme